MVEPIIAFAANAPVRAIWVRRSSPTSRKAYPSRDESGADNALNPLGKRHGGKGYWFLSASVLFSRCIFRQVLERKTIVDLFFKTATWAGSGLVLFPIALIIAGILWLRGRAADALLVSGGILGAFILVHGFKRLFARPRPNVQDLLVSMPSDFSFPSAHTTQAAAFALACAIALSRYVSTTAGLLIWGCLGLTVLLVGLSRVYLQVHYVSDVVAGAVLGAAWVLTLYRLLKWTDPQF